MSHPKYLRIIIYMNGEKIYDMFARTLVDHVSLFLQEHELFCFTGSLEIVNILI